MEFVWIKLCTFLVVLSATARAHATGHVDNAFLAQLLERVDGLEQKNRILESTVTSQQKQIDELKIKTVATKDQQDRHQRLILSGVAEGPVAFTARIDQRVVNHMSTNQTVIFPHELLDIGNSYNNHTGIFTVPLSGIYMVSCSLLDHMARHDGTGVMLHAEILQNERTLARVFAHADGPDYRDQGAQTIVVEAKQGDVFRVRIIDHTDLGLGGDMYSTFSAYMLWQY